MIKSKKVENWQTTQGLASFCFFHQNIYFFPVCFFPINPKPLSPAFLISHPFSPITASYFYLCDVIMQIQNWWLWNFVSERVSPSWNTLFVKKAEYNIWMTLKTLWMFVFEFPRSRLPSISFIYWQQNWKSVLSSSIIKMFWVHLIIFTDSYIDKNH